MRMSAIQKVANEKAKDRVSEKFELLVVAVRVFSLVRMGTMRERAREEIEISECVAEIELKLREIAHIASAAAENDLLSDLGSGALHVILEPLLGFILLNVQ